MSKMQGYVPRVEYSVLLEVVLLILCGPGAMAAVLVLPALPGVVGA